MSVGNACDGEIGADGRLKGAHRLEWACTRRHVHVHVHRAAACWRWGADIGQVNDFKGGVAGQIGARTAETEVWLALAAKPPFLGGTRALKLSPIQGRVGRRNFGQRLELPPKPIK